MSFLIPLVLLANQLKLSPQGTTWILLSILIILYSVLKNVKISAKAYYYIFISLLAYCLIFVLAHLLYKNQIPSVSVSLKYLALFLIASLSGMFSGWYLALNRYKSYLKYLLIVLLIFSMFYACLPLLDAISSRLVIVDYGSLARFSGLNGEPGPNAQALVYSIVLLLLITINVNRNLKFFKLSMIFMCLAFVCCLSVGQIFSLVASLFATFAIVNLLKVKTPRFLSLSFFSNFFGTSLKVIPFVAIAILVFLTPLTKLFNKTMSILDAITSNNLASFAGGRGDAFNQFFSNTSLSLLPSASESDLSYMFVSYWLSTITQYGLLLALLIFAIPAICLYIFLPSYLRNLREPYSQSYLFMVLYGMMSLWSLPQIHLYRIFFCQSLFLSFVLTIQNIPQISKTEK